MTEQRRRRQSASNASEQAAPGAGPFPMSDMPKTFLEAWLLLLLRTWGGHGYALADALNKLGFAGIDHTRIYRQLRSLERRGLLLSTWDVASYGPARRVYQLTKAGEDFLGTWAQALQGYTQMTSAFMNMYSGALKSMMDLQRGGSGGKGNAPKGKEEGERHGSQ